MGINETVTAFNGVSSFALPLADEDDCAFEKSVRLDFGVHYKATDNMTVRLNAYNLMGWIDKDYNKINEFQRSSHYQNEATAFALTLNYKF